jgi:hypothetical protein
LSLLWPSARQSPARELIGGSHFRGELMARYEADREDLLEEATALVERVELVSLRAKDVVVIGFRRNGCGSIYLGADPAFHFNSLGELRRAFAKGRLVKAEHRRLVLLDRVRPADAVHLERTDLSSEEQERVVEEWNALLVELRSRLFSGEFAVARQVPGDADVLARVKTWLESGLIPLRVAESSHVR